MGTPNPPGNPGDQPWEQPYGYQPQPQYPQVPPGPPPGYAAQPPGYPPQQPFYPAQPPGYPPQPTGYPVQSGYPGYGDPEAPYGRDPATGMPLSDKSATTAGLLQIFFGSFGVGRFYLDSTQIAAAQLCLGLAGLVLTVFCGIGIFLLMGVGIWGLVDGIMMMSGSVQDKYGRRLH